ncbi:hypothetical protein ALC57_15438, partial [Trachymyrmex cornetzi]
TASWKDNNVTRRLISAWKEHENNFKNGKYKSLEIWKKIVIVVQNNNNQWVYTKKKSKKEVQRELGEWSASLREDARQREQAKEQRHKELIAASDRAITAYKEMMGKLIDKL